MGEIFSSVDTIWVLLGALLVFFMQAGFAMVEAGFTRAKNAGNIIMKNLMDFCIGSVLFWFIGFGLMFGAGNGFIGGVDLLALNYQAAEPTTTFPPLAFLIFQTVFCATSATIVSGAMAERTKFISYCIYSAVISLVIYPVSGHWIWGGGWLSEMGFHDFAGSTAVHMVGGVAAFVGACFLGARIGKYSKDGKSHAIPGHNLTIGALGVFILWFAWFGFNGCSTVSMTGDDILASASNIFVTTNLAAATSALATMIFTWFKYKKPDVSMTLNGALAGLVAITAGCDAVNPVGAFFIGLIAGIVVVLAVEFIDKVLHVDDPVGAVAVHGCCGALGTILTGFFAVNLTNEDTGAALGVFYNGFSDWSFLGIQVLGVLAVIAWVAVTMIIVFWVLKHTIGLRVSKEEEIVGLDIMEHGLASSYADFMPTTGGAMASFPQEGAAEAPVEKAVPVEMTTTEGTPTTDENGNKFTKVVILARQNKFEDLKTAMNAIGVTGMTVTNVLGCGLQKGNTEYYRGVPLDMNLLPKIKVEIVVCQVPVRTVIETAKKVLYTGHIGDGKIFVYNIENVVKVRTGEEGVAALQDTEE